MDHMEKGALSFTKMSGAGNDFIFIDNREGAVPPAIRAKLAAHICPRMFSVGADGIIFIEKSSIADFSWDFYNADGSLAEMCGNGARCAARYAFSRGIAGAKMSFATLAGIIEAEVFADDTVCLQMTAPEDYRSGLSLELGGTSCQVDFLNTGVPHAVVYVDEVSEGQGIGNIPVQEWGRIVRNHDHFAPAGTNVNFVSRGEGNSLYVRTYERGVEDETMACGTGAVAAALCFSKKYGFASPVNIVSSGGEILSIAFKTGCPPQEAAPSLSGPARIIYQGELAAEALPADIVKELGKR
ncbi:diaminopimelate epimerase [Desulfotalea psychrophila]|uniref:Diaminopimelate epimerase n=1 Tax=Desulfotalea psychrophila (strain LSv54 / DSM 12343) TaxID=177439 RepID=Q6AR62_DESPS|nr:diaminopimelate epimerase [Desulfotalea psychrophila]CAG35162.1 probable diaminopimelate epimerase [Desulfotalea psychrophila LSv54]